MWSRRERTFELRVQIWGKRKKISNRSPLPLSSFRLELLLSAPLQAKLFKTADSKPKLFKMADSKPSPISNLPDDLLVHILKRLPNIRVAFSRKRVCKRWDSQMCSEHFLGQFAAHHLKDDECCGKLVSPRAQRDILKSVRFPEDGGDNVCVLGCLDDLILCGNRTGDLFVFNPFSKELVSLPPLGHIMTPNHKFVFGITIPADSRFQVSCFTEDESGGTVAWVFDSEIGGQWVDCSISAESAPNLEMTSLSIASSMGRLYWVSKDDRAIVYDPSYKAASSVDISQIFGEDKNYTGFHFGASKGILHFIVLHDIEDDLVVEVWRHLNEAGGRWILVCEAQVFSNWDKEDWPEDANQEVWSVTGILGINPLDPQLVYLTCNAVDFISEQVGGDSYVLCLDLGRKKCWVSVDDKLDTDAPFGWAVFQPRLSPRPTMLHRR